MPSDDAIERFQRMYGFPVLGVDQHCEHRHAPPLIGDFVYVPFNEVVSAISREAARVGQQQRQMERSITLAEAKKFFTLHEGRLHPRCWQVRKEYL